MLGTVFFSEIFYWGNTAHSRQAGRGLEKKSPSLSRAPKNEKAQKSTTTGPKNPWKLLYILFFHCFLYLILTSNSCKSFNSNVNVKKKILRILYQLSSLFFYFIAYKNVNYKKSCELQKILERIFDILTTFELVGSCYIAELQSWSGNLPGHRTDCRVFELRVERTFSPLRLKTLLPVPSLLPPSTTQVV